MFRRRFLWTTGIFLGSAGGLGAGLNGCGAVAVTDACTTNGDCNQGRVCVARVCTNLPPPTDASVEGGFDAGPIDSGGDAEDAGEDAGVDSGACFEAGARTGVVVFGGEDVNGNELGDTWLFDGTTWTQATAECTAPSARYDSAMATLGKSLVLFGGLDVSNNTDQDTWTFDGARWTQVPTLPTSTPPVRFDQSMAPLGMGATKVMMFGGTGDSYLSDTWTFDGMSWTALASSGPSARYGAAQAPSGDSVILFGGYNASGEGESGPIADTWTLGGTGWTQVVPPASPPARYDGAMAALGGEIVLFGGSEIAEDSGLGFLAGDTWTFDGTTWTQITGGIAPSARAGHGMATFGNKVVLFGGTDVTQNDLSDTWVFDGTAWQEVSVTAAPPERDGFAMATLP